MKEMDIEKEFMVVLERISTAKHNGVDTFRITEFVPGTTFVVGTGTGYRFIRGNHVLCPICAKDFKNECVNTDCVHAAIVKTWKRQGCPEMRTYFSTGDRIGYFGKGKLVTLSTVDQVNRLRKEGI